MKCKIFNKLINFQKTDNFHSGGLPSTQLYYAPLKIISNITCKASYPTLEITLLQVCTAGGTVDTCVGDNGGPLGCILSDGITYALVGVISWSTPCGSGLPSVYTSVSYYLEFLMGMRQIYTCI